MSADELRTAAVTLRERANAATPGPWTFTDSEDASSSAHIDGEGHVVMRDEYTPVALCSNDFYETDPGEVTPADDVAYIAAVHPGVGLDLADWLDEEAARVEMAAEGGADARIYEPAIRLARRINGGAS